MRREEKRRKFNEAVVKLLYPSPPKPEEDLPRNIHAERFETDIVLGDLGKVGSSSSDDGESPPQKLTRAQRKKHRRKKLKEDYSRRRQIVGPLLPSTNDDTITEVDGNKYDPQDVRRNASEKHGDESSNLGEEGSGRIHNNAKQRREAKKLGKQRLHPTAKSQQNQ